jgi:hypothetical protein
MTEGTLGRTEARLIAIEALQRAMLLYRTGFEAEVIRDDAKRLVDIILGIHTPGFVVLVEDNPADIRMLANAVNAIDPTYESREQDFRAAKEVIARLVKTKRGPSS